jgi:MoaA/NifB/PqqE/SkfB family radical SAM enzyme
MPENLRILKQRTRLYLSMLKARKLNEIRPVICNLFITTRCNGRCNYCYTDNTIPKQDELTTQEWKDVIDELYRLGCRMINLMGGEPLLREDFPLILEHIYSKNIVCDVNTNCFLVPEHIGVLKKATQIFTSLDGDETAHDLNRGKGTFERTKSGIMAAREAGIPVRVNCTVTRHNSESIDFLIDFCRKNNLYLTFTPLIRARKALVENTKELALNDREERDVFERIKEAKKGTRCIMNSDASLDHIIHYPVELNRIVRRNDASSLANYYTQPCPYGRLTFFIISNGDVYPCHNMWNEPTFKPGNVMRDGTGRALENAGDLWCKYCWLANLVEWNEFTSLSWLLKGIRMTFKQVF